jgi:hypothetical protein
MRASLTIHSVVITGLSFVTDVALLFRARLGTQLATEQPSLPTIDTNFGTADIHSVALAEARERREKAEDESGFDVEIKLQGA